MLRSAYRQFIGLFSSIWLGVTLLTLLFLYSSVGSAGAPIGPGMLRPWFILNADAWVPLREMRGMELTEFEWFHWWPFDLLIALICTNLIVATIRRIPFNAINAGVWMIHSGIIILALGSVYYFGTKVEGDAPVIRRQVVIATPDGRQSTMAALPGNQKSIITPQGRYDFRITGIDPQWEILSGEDQGERAYSVNVSVTTPQRQFIRQLIAGYPQYTEDLVRTSDPNQPFKRAIKETGSPIVDDSIALDLEYMPATDFYLMNSRAIYLHELGSDTWVMRPVDDLPRFNDYIADYDQVWVHPSDLRAGGMPRMPIDPIDVVVPAVSPDDPLPGVDLHLTGFLRYAFEDTRLVPGGDRLDPVATVRLETGDGQRLESQLIAFDPSANTAEQGLLQFVWAQSAEARQAMTEIRDALLRIRVPQAGVELDAAVRETASRNPGLDFTPIEGTDYAYRVTALQDGLAVRPGVMDSLAIVEIRTPEQTFTRWVFEDAALTRDLRGDESMPAHGGAAMIDEGITMTYVPGRRAAPLTVIGGPGEDDLGVLVAFEPGLSRFQEAAVGQAVQVAPMVSLTVTAMHARNVRVTKPAIVPPAQRDRDMGPNASLVRLQVADGPRVHTQWLRFHSYAFASPEQTLRRFLYQPKIIEWSEGSRTRRIEVMFARQRMPLPAPVALHDFVVATHIGGFTGQTASIRDWVSKVVFHDESGWTDPADVHMNAPEEFRGYWFFQAQWDPPEPARFAGDTGSAGLNYSVLGVGNRNGVVIQLTGCCIAVAGMIYAFYVKPMLKRGRRKAVYGTVAEEMVAAHRPRHVASESQPQPVGAAMEGQS